MFEIAVVLFLMVASFVGGALVMKNNYKKAKELEDKAKAAVDAAKTAVK
jgi:UPF0716 family protein affecting phage T7 exclusion